MPNSKKTKLAPCPFCGGEAKEEKTYIKQSNFMVYYVGCYSKECSVNACASFQNSELPEIGWDKPKRFMEKRLREEAIKAWNRRAK